MKGYARSLCAALALLFVSESARADIHSLGYGGYQPWWNIFAKRNRFQSAEEERLQRFWRDYYDSLHRYYRSLERIDWVTYYKNHGYRINGGGMGGCGAGGCSTVQFAPVQVSPAMQWAAPGGASCAPPALGAPCGPMGCPVPGMMGGFPGMGMPAMGMGMPHPGMGYGMPAPGMPAPVMPAGYFYGQ